MFYRLVLLLYKNLFYLSFFKWKKEKVQQLTGLKWNAEKKFTGKLFRQALIGMYVRIGLVKWPFI